MAGSLEQNSGNVYADAFKQLPNAGVELAKEAWDHPLDTTIHVGTTLGVSALAGAAFSYLLPARSPVSLAIGGIMMLPTAIHMVKGIIKAHDDAAQPGADVHQVGHDLAKNSLAGTFDLGLNFAGGYFGAKGAYSLAESDSAAGAASRDLRAGILNFENRSLLKGKEWLGLGTKSSLMESSAAELAAGLEDVRPTGTSGKLGTFGIISRRLDQVAGTAETAGETPVKQYFVATHGHTKLTDGDADLGDFFDGFRKKGYDGVFDTEHNHNLARKGVPAGSDRANAEEGTTILADDPPAWTAMKKLAKEKSVPGQFYADVGLEVGTIGKTTPAPVDGKIPAGGGNHTILLNTDNLVRTTIAPKPRGFTGVIQSLGRRLGLVADEPNTVTTNVIDVPDGRFDIMAQQLKGNEVAGFAHPRYRQDIGNTQVPQSQLGHDYGGQSFGDVYPNRTNWFQNWVNPRVRFIETMKGEALNSNHVPTLKPQDFMLGDYNGYLDLGVHAGPAAGPDIHYAVRIGDPPLATGILAKSLDGPGLADGLMQRRTIATSNFKLISGVLKANDGKFTMGDILDEAAVPKGITPTIEMGGKVTPDATYTFKLWSDPQVGDGKLATIIQEHTVSGKDLIAQGNKFTFDPVQHRLGSKSLVFGEVHRIDPTSPTYGDVLSQVSSGEGNGLIGTVSGDGFVSPQAEQLLGIKKPIIQNFDHPMEIDGTEIRHMWQPVNPDVAAEYNVPKETPYPERMYTAPIWIEPLAGTQHSILMQGIAGTGANFFPINPSAHK